MKEKIAYGLLQVTDDWNMDDKACCKRIKQQNNCYYFPPGFIHKQYNLTIN
jgi:hypothetical protein